MLGSAGRNVQLVGVDANPRATALQDVAAYSQVHGMLHAWDFLTGSLPALRASGTPKASSDDLTQSVDHTPAIFLINPRRATCREYIVQQSYAAIGQLGPLIAAAPRACCGAPGGRLETVVQAIPGSIRPAPRPCRSQRRQLEVGPGAPAPAPVLRDLGPADHRPRWRS